MLRFTAILFLITLTPLCAKVPQYWKHSAQQGDVGACHAFSTIALIEAAYKMETGKYVDLSERDLFIRHYLQPYQSADDCIRTQLQQSLSKKLDDHHGERGHIDKTFFLAKAHGLATERELPYEPTFSKGVSISISLLRHHRNQLHLESLLQQNQLKKSPQLRKQAVDAKYAKLKGIKNTFHLGKRSATRSKTRAFLANYKITKFTPKTTPQAKRWLIEQVKNQPVAADITNLNELIPPKQRLTRSIHGRHSLVVSHYHADTDSFTIRSSTFKGSNQVPANTLARGCYQLYKLERK